MVTQEGDALRIIECKIIDFGTLHDSSFDFSKGINRIVRENGFGKSTLAAFIRVMLYGFEGEGKRDLLGRERKFYEPWQGGRYGGSLVFETKGKTYRVTRTFGKKAEEDTFELLDLSTNLESGDYSSKLGLELFDMDSDTFRRTVFVGQDSIETSVNDTINGRIGALVDNTDDLDAYDKAKESLEAVTNSLTPRRKTGEVSKLNERITSLDADILPADKIEASMESVLAMRAEESDKLHALKEEKEILTARAKELGSYMEIAGRKERYETLISDKEEKEKAVREFALNLPAGVLKEPIPDTDEMRNMSREYMTASSQLSGSKLLDLSEREELALNKLISVYGEEDPTQEALTLIDEWKEYRAGDKELEELEEKLRSMRANAENESASARKKMKAFLILTVILGIGAVVLFLIPGLFIAGAAVAAATLLCACLTFVFRPSGKKDYDPGEDELSNLEDTVNSIKTERAETLSSIDFFLSRYGKDSEPEMIPVSLKEVLSDRATLLDLRSKKDRAESAASSSKEVMNRVERFITEELGTELSGDPCTQLQQTADRTDRYRDALRALRETEELLARFERENDVEMLRNTTVPKDDATLSEVTQRLSEVSRLADESAERLAGFDKRSDELSEAIEEIAQKRADREALTEERDRKKEIFECCELAKEYLTKAKETLSARYIEPIQKKFIYYHGMITGEKTAEYMVDANIDVSVSENGLKHSVLQLSRGLRDVVGLSLRMAFIDVMFPQEKPVLILDDPFVNLDRTNYEAAEKLMDLIAEDYQVIYFAARDEGHEEIVL